jgi:hypothetical protein
LAAAGFYGQADNRRGLGRAKRTRTRAALLLEWIALRHQIAVVGAERNSSPVFSPFGLACFGYGSALCGPIVAKACSSSSPRPSCAGALKVGPRCGDIDRVVAGEPGVQGSPARSNLAARWPVRIFSGCFPDSQRASHARFRRFASHGIALPACTKPEVESFVANLS